MSASRSRTRRMLLVAATSAALVLTGCATAQAGAEAPAESAPPSTAPVAPSPTPTPTATEEPAAWTIGFDSLGPITLGGEIAAIEQNMEGFTLVVYEGCEWISSFEKPGLPAIVIPDLSRTGLVEQILVQDGDAPAGVAAGAPRTAAGIGIGSSLGELQTAYPDIEFQDDHFTPHYGVPDDAGHWILFAVHDDVVTSIVIRDRPVITREYCG